MMNDNKTISQIIKNARKNLGFTQEKLAEKIEITPHQLSRLEVGEYIPSLPTFLKLVSVLNLSLDDFCSEKNHYENKTLYKYIKLLNSLNNNELEFCFNSTKTLVKNFDLFKNYGDI